MARANVATNCGSLSSGVVDFHLTCPVRRVSASFTDGNSLHSSPRAQLAVARGQRRLPSRRRSDRLPDRQHAIATYVLIAIAKKTLQLDASLSTCLHILSVSIFEKTQLSCALQTDPSPFDPADEANQLILFDV